MGSRAVGTCGILLLQAEAYSTKPLWCWCLLSLSFQNSLTWGLLGKDLDIYSFSNNKAWFPPIGFILLDSYSISLLNNRFPLKKFSMTVQWDKTWKTKESVHSGNVWNINKIIKGHYWFFKLNTTTEPKLLGKVNTESMGNLVELHRGIECQAHLGDWNRAWVIWQGTLILLCTQGLLVTKTPEVLCLLNFPPLFDPDVTRGRSRHHC